MKHIRKRLRLEKHDYSRPGAYFVTVCVSDSRFVLSRISQNESDDPKTAVTLTEMGKAVEEQIISMNDHYDDIKVDHYIIMPDHVHMLISIPDSKQKQVQPADETLMNKKLPMFISTFKRYVNRRCGKNIWQRSFNDHIIVGSDDYDKHVQYIMANPEKWE